MSKKNAPVERKVQAATAGAGVGAALAGAILWGLDEAFWNGAAVPEVPAPITALVFVAVPAVLAYASGWYAKHTPRPGSENS